MLTTKVRLNIIYLFCPRHNGAPRAKPVVSCGRDEAVFDEEYPLSIRIFQVFEVLVQD